MDKRKQKTVNKNDKGPIEAPKPKPKPEKTGAEVFQEYAESMKKAVEKLGQENQELRRQLGSTNQRMEALVKTAPDQKPPNIMDVINAITGILNSTPVKMITEKFMGGEEETPISQSQVPVEMLDFYNKHFKATMNATLDAQLEDIRARRLKNDVTQKEIDSDL